jgi:hypothetical protein
MHQFTNPFAVVGYLFLELIVRTLTHIGGSQPLELV